MAVGPLHQFRNKFAKARVVGLVGTFLYVCRVPWIETARVKFHNHSLLVRNNKLDLLVAMSNSVDELPMIKGLFEQDSKINIVDAGAYIGTSTIILKDYYPNSNIVCLEVSPGNLEVLRQNAECLTGVKIVNKGLVGRDSGTLLVRDRLSGEWGHSIVDSPADQENSIVISEVEPTTLLELRNSYFEGGLIDILKLDIEGGEILLAEDSPEEMILARVILLELHERVSPGVTAKISKVISGRKNFQVGEKIVSIDQSFFQSLKNN